MQRILRRVLLGVAAGVAVYAGFTLWADAREVAAALADFAWSAALLALLLAATNYLIRFIRWHYYLRVLKLTVPAGESLLIFLGGFALTVTPGKLGEVIKAFMLRESRGIAAARTAPLVVAERFTDLGGLLLLAALGAFTFDVDRRFLGAGAMLVVVGWLVVSIESLARWLIRGVGRLPGLRRFADKAGEFYDSTASLLRPLPLLVGLGLSAVSWYCECLAFWVVVEGFGKAHVDHQAATFIYATMTIAGALSFFPGGLGVTEAGMLGLLTQLGTGATRSVAAAATFVTRVCTLWFAVLVGVLALVLFTRRTNVRVALPAPTEPRPG